MSAADHAGTSPAATSQEPASIADNVSVPAHAIVVGLDHSPHSAAALEWAAAEAVSRGLPLHLMHAVLPPLWPDSPGLSQFEEDPAGCVTDAVRALADSCAGLAVTWSQPYGSAVPALTWASRFATLIVVGTRAHGPLQQVVTGSTAVELIADSRCPVVVVRTLSSRDHAGPVVVGVGGASDSTALQAAFQEAQVLESTVVVVHVTDYGFLERADVESMVAEAQRSHHGVAVKVRLVNGNPTDVLIAHSAQASLVVLGSHGRHEATGFVLGSVSQSVLRRAMCPVLVARTGTLRTTAAEPASANNTREDAL